jgi:hypothetical protein
MKNWLLKTIFLAIIIIALTGCSLIISSTSSKFIKDEITEAFNDVNIVYEDILHIEIYNDGVIVFYINKFGELAEAFIKEDINEWTWVMGTGSHRRYPEESVSWTITNKMEVPLHLIYGTARADISQIKTIDTDRNIIKNAKMIKTPQGITIWFSIFDQGLNGAKVEGYNANGDLVYPSR